MGQRSGLDATLRSITSNVYFQPPESIKLTYPCIIYRLNNIDAKYANNLPYNWHTQYILTIIDRDKDSSLVDAVKTLPFAAMERAYTASNLYHYQFRIYY